VILADEATEHIAGPDVMSWNGSRALPETAVIGWIGNDQCRAAVWPLLVVVPDVAAQDPQI
jgi:hypothetical protein